MKAAARIALVPVAAALLLSGAAGVSHSAVPAPHGFKILVDGKSMPLSPASKVADVYHPVSFGVVSVAARWTGTLSRTRYRIRLLTVEPQLQVYATCLTGTTCKVRVRVPLLPGEEMSWELDLVKNGRPAPVVAYRVCIIGK